MTWKSFIPLAGKKSVSKKLREIEDEAATLPVIFGVLFTKVFEMVVTGKLGLAFRFLLASLAAAAAYIYKHEAKEAAKAAKEKAEEVTEDEE
jgi:hypothetical protein